MASTDVKQPLVSVHSTPPFTDTKKSRFHRSISAPTTDTQLESGKAKALFPGSKLILGAIHPSFRQVILLLATYLGTGITCFFFVRHQLSGKKTNVIIDALYFCVVTMTTVGYGDIVPNSVLTKLLACAFVFFGMALVALFLSKAADYLVEKQEMLLIRGLHLRKKVGTSEILKELETNRVRYKFIISAVFLLVLIAVGTAVLWRVEKLEFIDAFYCVCSTITTLGYGDKSFSTEGGRVFAIIWILASTVCVAQFFLYLAELNAERRQQLLTKWVLKRRMTFMDLEAADIDKDGVVGSADFVIYKLKEMGKISQEDITIVMEEFENLDVDHSGTLSVSDLLIAQSTQ
ncbi:Two pore potassium channel a [Acorus gramineus]|uniref:Two pore potassium channel a n=1 Tax=Acorus gramineus TaxID=55184 RepID=A0AAV9B8Y0_ACOGR|nr:Two pore potassium channel a [Acorus gramineus]KAK1272562.1 Two pore potassium channel a [Acorus gramineus]